MNKFKINANITWPKRMESSLPMTAQTDQIFPFVSVIVPMYNEERFITTCIDRLLAQDYPADKYEIIIIDGESSDASPVIMASLQQKNPDKIQVHKNPMRITSKAWNIGIEHARGDIIALMSAHAEAPVNYISLCARYLQQEKVENVGGIMDTIGRGFWGESIAIGTSNPFGIGNSKHRYSDKPTYDEAGWPGSYWKETLLSVGGFDENMPMNEDDDLNYRLQAQGMKMFLTPEIRVTYYCRDSLISLWKQYFKYGRWKVRVLQKYGKLTSWRHFIPPLFVMGLILSLVILLFFPDLWPIPLIILVPYLLLSAIITFRIAARRGAGFLLSLPLIFFILHLSYGVGFLSGLNFMFSGHNKPDKN